VGHYKCGKTHPHASDGGDDLQIRRTATNVFNKKSGEPTRGGPLPRNNLFYRPAYR